MIADLPGGRETHAVEGVKYHKNMVILKLSGIDTMDAAQRYRSCDLLISRDQALPLAENEYFIADLIGLAVSSDTGEELGTLTDVLQTGANDVYLISSPKYGEILIPVIKDCVIRTELEAGKMTVHLLPGLLELNRKQ